jgi:hypothetical protein
MKEMFVFIKLDNFYVSKYLIYIGFMFFLYREYILREKSVDCKFQ